MLIKPIKITGSGAVGDPSKTLIKSGRAKNPARANNKSEILLRTATSLKDKAP